MLTDDEKNLLHLMLEDKESGYRAKIILLKDEGYTVPEIRKITNHHDHNIRKWIHRFNEKGIDGIISKKHNHKQHKFDNNIEKQIVDITSANPRSFNLGFSTWSLRVLAGFLMYDLKLVDKISHSEIRNILLKHKIKWRKSKTVLSNKRSNDPEYFEKKYIEQLRYNTPSNSVLLYVDEKGPVTAKTHGGTSWSSVQVKIEKAQKINGLLNVFGAYDHTNDKMHVQCYKRKTGKQFVDFLKRVDKRYDKNIQNIFLVLDNLSAHKSKMVKKEIANDCPRIKLVFLPVRSPELNLIEVRWLWLQRQTINNSTFKDEQEIGRAVSKWKNIYNKNHGKAITNILQEDVPLYMSSRYQSPA